jgi:hypothetical protein
MVAASVQLMVIFNKQNYNRAAALRKLRKEKVNMGADGESDKIGGLGKRPAAGLSLHRHAHLLQQLVALLLQ